MIKVLDSRYDIANEAAEVVATKPQTVCLANEEYYGLISALVVILSALLVFATLLGIVYRRYWALGMKNAEVNGTNGNQSKITLSPSRPLSFLVNASQALRNKRSNGPRELVPDYYNSFSGFSNGDGKLSYSLFGLKNRADSDFRKGWNDSGFKLSRKLKEGTLGKSAGSISKKMFETLFSQDVGNLKKTAMMKKNPLNCDDNFVMAKSEVRLEDPSEPIYTDPSLFDLERSRSLRSIAVPEGDGQQTSKASDEV